MLCSSSDPCHFGWTGLASLSIDAAHQLWGMEKQSGGKQKPMEKQSGGKQKPSVSVICNCNLLVYDNRAGNNTVHVCEECAIGWLWSIFALPRRYASLGLCSKSCKLHQMAASFCARFKANSESKKHIS